MRRGEPGAALTMRSALLVLLLLGVISSCRGTTVAGTTAGTSVRPTTSAKPTTLTTRSATSPLTTLKTTASATAAKSSVPATAPQTGSPPPSTSTGTTNKPADTTTSGAKGPPATAATSVAASTTKPPSATVTASTKATSAGPRETTTSVTGVGSKAAASTPHASIVATSAPTLKPESSAAVTPGKSPGAAGTTPGSGAVTTVASTTEKSTSRVVVPPAAVPTEKPKKAESTTRTVTTKELGGTAGSTATHTPGAAPAPPGSSPGTSVTKKTPSASPQPPVAFPDTSFVAQSKIVCEKAAPPEDQAIILTLNQSTPCSSLEKSSAKEALLNVLCKAVKPTFNQSRDGCLARLASKDDPKYLAVLEVAVLTNSADKELFESLAAKMEELEKIGVKNITHGGRSMDPDMEDRFSMPLIITIVCMAASLLLGAAIYGCCHQRLSRRKDQQRLTEELQTMENGYHDNPTLEVMETSSEMQEKKVNLNGELGDSWIVPMDSLTKEDLEDEEDTHL
ncbi:podocalyxin [Lacerta agilis]|uniref:podocalyxin n=1 Tax=Lacerta agilis TaxID=80427 RepID=UPI001419A05C|nr:podocalyxin [Lacerta agilis]